jgi:hypothetical protein
MKMVRKGTERDSSIDESILKLEEEVLRSRVCRGAAGIGGR